MSRFYHGKEVSDVSTSLFALRERETGAFLSERYESLDQVQRACQASNERVKQAGYSGVNFEVVLIEESKTVTVIDSGLKWKDDHD